jgi:hypothetical protein
VTERRLRYSERKRLAETGGLGPLQADTPIQLLNAVRNVIENGTSTFRNRLSDEVVEHFGWRPGSGWAPALTEDADVFLDFCEIAVETANRRQRHSSSRNFVALYAGLEERLNTLFERHRFGYRLQGGEARQVASPALSDVVVGPALLAVQRPGWTQIDRQFREALLHQRGGDDENDDAITAAAAALESALKAVGASGNTLGELAKDFRKSGRAAPQVAATPELLEDLLKRIAAVRNIHGDAHGKDPSATPVPEALVDLTIHMVGAFIVYLAETATQPGERNV